MWEFTWGRWDIGDGKWLSEGHLGRMCSLPAKMWGHLGWGVVSMGNFSSVWEIQ